MHLRLLSPLCSVELRLPQVHLAKKTSSERFNLFDMAQFVHSNKYNVIRYNILR